MVAHKKASESLLSCHPSFLAKMLSHLHVGNMKVWFRTLLILLLFVAIPIQLFGFLSSLIPGNSTLEIQFGNPNNLSIGTSHGGLEQISVSFRFPIQTMTNFVAHAFSWVSCKDISVACNIELTKRIRQGDMLHQFE